MTNHVNRKSPVALVIVDVVNHFEFPDGGRLLRQAMAIVQPLAGLRDRARKAGLPVIYVNDNSGNGGPMLPGYWLIPCAPSAPGGILSGRSSWVQTTTVF